MRPRLATVLLAEDDDGMRDLLAVVLRESPHVGVVIEARDGAEAVQLGLQLRPAIALLDFHMPRLDGIAVALTLRELVPAMAIALQSSDRHALRDRAEELRLPLFDKHDLDHVAAWVEARARPLNGAGPPPGPRATLFAPDSAQPQPVDVPQSRHV
jgi:DNA-binding NarL/FixJ family response regulator